MHPDGFVLAACLADVDPVAYRLASLDTTEVDRYHHWRGTGVGQDNFVLAGQDDWISWVNKFTGLASLLEETRPNSN